jgi:hypothetical protein
MMTKVNNQNNAVKFLDRPCGTGKSTRMISSFETGKHYFVVVPTIDEVQRVLKESKVPFTQPQELLNTDTETCNKMNHLLELVADGENIVTTHALFDNIDLRKVDLRMYEVLIDEVFDCVVHKQGPDEAGFQKVYLDSGLATVDEQGNVKPTDKWIATGDSVFKYRLLDDALRGRLYKAADGFYVSVVPPSLFTGSNSCTVHTYLAEGSLMAAYLRKYGIRYTVDVDHDLDRRQRAKARQLLSVKKFDLPIDRLGYQKQKKMTSPKQKECGGRIKKERERGVLKGLVPSKTLVTCRKGLWLDESDKPNKPLPTEARMKKAHWCHKSTKGTNSFKECDEVLHMYDLNLNPAVAKFLNLSPEMQDEWRKSELIQFIYRTNIREKNAGPVRVFFASQVMMNLFLEWMTEEQELELLEAA